MNRCKWCNLNNQKYIYYHDNVWGLLNTSDDYLYKMLILETFQAGLSWECILNKIDDFCLAYDNFDIDKVAGFDENKILELYNNHKIIRNKRKILASINNSKIFKNIIKEYGSFYNYLCTFTNGKVFYEIGIVSSLLSDKISEDLKRRGMSFVGTITIYSFLQAVGIIYSHEKECFLYKNKV